MGDEQNRTYSGNSNPPGSGLGDVYDRVMGGLHGVPDVLTCKPTTLRWVTPMIGASQTYIVQTYRHKELGDTIFVEQTSASGHVRIVIPPNVAEAIARQRAALSDRLRSRASKESMAERMAAGYRPTFGGKRGKRKTAAKAKAKAAGE